ncbi:hypothetical protein [Actinomadura violacea]|uniref:Guanylate cyclase domain-containing protein n=1 Tax=Actinomadura violacea TaxID=2819934 RepID=A0ABS3RVP2_9ACTN|nr:hypothetical protein [Actinomadura violacea]MBO2460701.1 hypothetical protein [Actinomadura violacea]
MGGWAPRPAAAPADPRHYTCLLAVDVVGFSAPHRDEAIQEELRGATYELVRRAFEMTWLPWEACHVEDRGDGMLVVLPPGMPGHLLLDPLAHHLGAMLRHSNRCRSEASRLRLRVAVSAGFVRRDAYGVAGHAVIHLFRLLDAPAFKEAIELSGSDVGLLVGDRMFEDVTGSGAYVERERYRPVHVVCKETKATAWLWTSGSGPA